VRSRPLFAVAAFSKPSPARCPPGQSPVSCRRLPFTYKRRTTGRIWRAAPCAARRSAVPLMDISGQERTVRMGPHRGGRRE
jgi:hypothetical protein